MVQVDDAGGGPSPAAVPDEASTALGRVSGRPLHMATRGATVLVTWGEGLLAATLAARDNPERSAGAAIRSAWPECARPQRAGACWPGRLRLSELAPGNAPLAAALNGAEPVLWWGTNTGTETLDRIRWNGLRGLVRRFLTRLPMEPRPERIGLVEDR